MTILLCQQDDRSDGLLHRCRRAGAARVPHPGGTTSRPATGQDARILYMTTLSVADARARFSKLVESASTTHERFEVTRNGSRAAVLLGADDYDALLEMVDILADSEAVAAIRAGLDDLEPGQSASVDEVRQAMVQAGRLPE